MGGDTEQPQEGELDHAYRGALGVHVGELGGEGLGRAKQGGRKRVSRESAAGRGWEEMRGPLGAGRLGINGRQTFVSGCPGRREVSIRGRCGERKREEEEAPAVSAGAAPGAWSHHPRNRSALTGSGQAGPAPTCVTSSRGSTQVSPPAVKLQNTRKASLAQPWLGSTQYSPVG